MNYKIKTYMKIAMKLACIYTRSVGKSPKNLAYGAGATALLSLPMIYMIAPDYNLFGIAEINPYLLLATYAGAPLAYLWAKKADELRLGSVASV